MDPSVEGQSHPLTIRLVVCVRANLKGKQLARLSSEEEDSDEEELDDAVDSDEDMVSQALPLLTDLSRTACLPHMALQGHET